MKAARYEITKVQAYFTRCGYAVRLFNADDTAYVPWLPIAGSLNMRLQYTRFAPCPMPATFYGNDGRKVRAEAIQFAKEYVA